MSTYSKDEILHGSAIRAEKEETPQTFHGTKKRMAGEMGEFALKMMSDPAAIQQNKMWMDAFSQSNEGMQFNQAKMMMMGGGVPPTA